MVKIIRSSEVNDDLYDREVDGCVYEREPATNNLATPWTQKKLRLVEQPVPTTVTYAAKPINFGKARTFTRRTSK